MLQYKYNNGYNTHKINIQIQQIKNKHMSIIKTEA